jgi:hypothetical protein
MLVKDVFVVDFQEFFDDEMELYLNDDEERMLSVDVGFLCWFEHVMKVFLSSYLKELFH